MDKLHYIYDNLVEIYHDTWINRFPYVIKHISKYIDSHSQILETKYINQRLIYGTVDENGFYEASGIDKKIVDRIVRESPNVDKSIPDKINPLYNSMMILSCFYEANKELLNKKYKVNIESGELVRFYLALKLYSKRQLRQFKHPFKNEIMDYVLENLNKKYILANVANLYEWIKYNAETNNKSIDADLSYIIDTDIYKYVNKLENRMKEAMKAIFQLALDAHDAGSKIVTEDIQAKNEEGQLYYTVTASVSNTIESLTKKIMQAFIQDQNIRIDLLKVACKKTNSSTSKVERMLKAIRESKDEKLMRRLISDILSYWIVSKKHTPESIHSTLFINSCASAYSISHTYDIFIIDLKSALQELLEKCSSEYMQGSQSSKNGYKQSIFVYILFYIMKIN